jgi:hypothetical protein
MESLIKFKIFILSKGLNLPGKLTDFT